MSIEKIKALKEKLTAYQAQVQSEAKDLVKGAFGEFFQANPDVSAIHWRQWTPHFNDGDACTFSIHDASVYLGPPLEDTSPGKYPADEEDDDATMAGGIWINGFYNRPDDIPDAAFKQAKDAHDLVFAIGDDLMESTFGDHCYVVATPDGKFEVNECSHD